MKRYICTGLALVLCLMLFLPQALAEDIIEQTIEQPVEAEQSGDTQENTEVPDEEPSAESESEPESESEAETEEMAESEQVHIYDARWSGGAFYPETMNYTGEVIMGVGATRAIAPETEFAFYKSDKSFSKLGKVKLSYDSSNPSHLSVSDAGLIVAQKKGSAQLMATVLFPDGTQKQLRKSFRIVDSPDIRFAPDEVVISHGGMLDLGQYANVPMLKASPNVNANVRYSLAALTEVEGSVVNIDAQNGKLTANFDNAGAVYQITATTYGGKTATFTLTLGIASAE